MNQTTIRKATISDLEIIQKISIQTFVETFAEVNTVENMANYIEENFNLEQIASEINNPNSQFYLATLSSEVMGYLKINLGDAQTEIHSQQAMEIHRIYVLKEFHGKKIGQLLLDEAIKTEKKLELILFGLEFGKKIIEHYNFTPKMVLSNLTNIFLPWVTIYKPIC